MTPRDRTARGATGASNRRSGARARPAAPRRQHAPTRRAAPAPRRTGGSPDRRSAGRSRPPRDAETVPATRRSLRGAPQFVRPAAPQPSPRQQRPRRARPTTSSPAPARTRTSPRRGVAAHRKTKRRDPRQRARRTIRTRRVALATRFAAGQPRRRLLATLVALLAILGAVLVKVGLLQTFEGDALRRAATEQWTRVRTLPAQRGAIFDRNGDELALSVPAATIAVNPQQVEDPAATADRFAEILDLSWQRRDELEAEMAARDRGFVYVARQVDTDLAGQLDALELPGVTTYREDRRTLPGGVTGISVIGRTDIDGVGIAGLERQYDDVLAGTPGESRLEVAPDGRSVAGTESASAPVPGHDLVLTIDRSVQYATEQALLTRVGQTRAEGGQAIVLDTDTGEVIAMASVQLDDGAYEVTSGNYSAVAAYEPGSVGKVITIAGALNEGTVERDTYFTVPWRKQYTKAGDFLHDSHIHGDEWLSVEDILVESSNIGTITVSETMGFERQYGYMRAFGLGEKTALDFPDESAGILEYWEEWEGTEKFTVAYGQGVASTPIQLAAAVNVIANDGLYVAPRLVVGTVDGSGELQPADAAETRRVVDEETAVHMQQMMREVVCRGTAKAAQIPGLSVAGKTGTGFIAQADGTYFREDGSRAYYASFVGFLPAEDPQVTILISIDQPDADSGDRFGGTAAAPVFRELAPTMVHELGIDPPLGSTGCAPS